MKPSTGKRLDLSGLFLCLILAIGFAAFDLFGLAVSMSLGILAFVSSLATWECDTKGQLELYRWLCIVFTIAAVVVFLASVVLA